MKNNSKGAAKLASVLQARMNMVSSGMSMVAIEKGEILSGGKLKLYSIPDSILDKDDYSVCATVARKLPCQKEFPIKDGDCVLVAWTYDGEPVVIDKVVTADSKDAKQELNWKVHCSHCTSPGCSCYGNGKSN